MTTLRRWAADESLWVTVASIVAGVLSTVGLGNLAEPVKIAIDSAAGVVASLYIGSQAHLKATAIKATGAAATPTRTGAPSADPALGEATVLLRQVAAKLTALAAPPASA